MLTWSIQDLIHVYYHTLFLASQRSGHQIEDQEDLHAKEFRGTILYFILMIIYIGEILL